MKRSSEEEWVAMVTQQSEYTEFHWNAYLKMVKMINVVCIFCHD